MSPATVTKVSKRQIKPTKKVAAKRKPRSVAKSYHIKVHPLVWAKAMELAGGHRSLIEVREATTVVVHNPGWKG